MVVFWFFLITLLVVVAAVTLAVGGGSGGGALADAAPDRIGPQLPAERPLGRADVDALRLPVALRGYRMVETDDALDRLAAELAERDARIAELEAALAGAQASAMSGPGLLEGESGHPARAGRGEGGGQEAGQYADGRADGRADGDATADGRNGGSGS
ncbi:DivIVA domain-containing protein [Streptomyces syringium]|uniref:DivIVA domain-containing protein n=1 Tax=Streptomyces syringium TaxID=76729 RepID=UPI003D8DCF8F